MEYNNKWRTSIDIFQGYTRAKLETIGDDIRELKESFIQFNGLMNNKIDTQNKKIHKINGKVAGLAAIVSVVVSLVVLILSKLIS